MGRKTRSFQSEVRGCLQWVFTRVFCEVRGENWEEAQEAPVVFFFSVCSTRAETDQGIGSV